MGLGGVILAGVGIVMVVLVANDRWDATWNAMLGGGGAGNGAANSTPAPYVQNDNGQAGTGSAGSWG